MGTHARIENGFISIDTTAWLEQRTGGLIDDLTTDLYAWAEQERTARAASHRSDGDLCEWQRAILNWCAARGYGSTEPLDPDTGPMVIVHQETRLDHDLWLARVTTREWGPIVVAQLDDEAPLAYADTVTDSGEWFDADTVEIACPNRHGWIWRTGRELLTADTLTYTTLTVVFGSNLDAPFTRCRVCQAYEDGRRSVPCGCDATPWIVCPICGQRCDVHLPVR